MPHFRKRHVTEAFLKLCKFSPIVGIFGHRQVGKTTFLETNSKDYKTLDEDWKFASEKPQAFLKELKGDYSAIDECQLAPSLFPVLKSWVQKNKKPGQFLLSGSVRFTSRKAIRESLTGRIATIELYPFVLSEVRKDALPDILPWAMTTVSFSGFQTKVTLSSKEQNLRTKNYKIYLENGGLPGFFLIREKKTRSRLMQDVLRTMLDRDLRLVCSTSLPFSDIFEFCQTIAKQPMEAIEYVGVSRKIGISPKTIKKLLDALESIYLIRKIPLEGGGRKGFSIWFEDQYEHNHLAEETLSLEQKRVGCSFRNARAQFEYRLGSTPTYFQYLTRGGAFIPLGIRQGKNVLGILPLQSVGHYGRSEQASVASFLKTYNFSKVIVTTDEPCEPHCDSDRILITPVSTIY